MRGIIQDKVSHQFIEGPGQSIDKSNSRVTNNEKAAHHADLSQGHGDQEDDNASMYDNDKPYNDPNERYD